MYNFLHGIYKTFLGLKYNLLIKVKVYCYLIFINKYFPLMVLLTFYFSYQGFLISECFGLGDLFNSFKRAINSSNVREFDRPKVVLTVTEKSEGPCHDFVHFVKQAKNIRLLSGKSELYPPYVTIIKEIDKHMTQEIIVMKVNDATDLVVDNVTDPCSIESSLKDKLLNKTMKKIIAKSTPDPEVLFCKRTLTYKLEVEQVFREGLATESEEQWKKKASSWFPKIF
jgi:hypothetical protein